MKHRTHAHEPCLSEYQLDRYAYGHTSEEETTHCKAHLAWCERCQNDLALLEQAQRASQTVTLPSAPSTWSWAVHWIRSTPSVWMPMLGTACLLAIVMWSSVPQQSRRRGDAGMMIRGDTWAQLIVALRRGPVVRPALSGEVFWAGDRLRLGYRSNKRGFLFVVHRDATGVVSPLYPGAREARSLRIEPGGDRLLPESLEVEGKPHGDESIWACFSEQALGFSSVKAALPAAKPGLRHWSPQRRGACRVLLHFLLRRPRP